MRQHKSGELAVYLASPCSWDTSNPARDVTVTSAHDLEVKRAGYDSLAYDSLVRQSRLCASMVSEPVGLVKFFTIQGFCKAGVLLYKAMTWSV